VIFDPDVYPLNWAFWDGKMSEELYHEEHALDALRQVEERAAAETKTRGAAADRADGDGSGHVAAAPKETETKRER